MYPKRKMELEDITNRQKKAKLDKGYYPVQQRLPSPSSCLLSPQKTRQKLVSFELSKNQHYENSPLLTPKDDDEYDLEHVPESQLDRNADYVALCATLDLLNDTKARIERDLLELSRLQKAAKAGSKLALVEFYVRLICHDSSLPGQHRIVRAPTVLWEKYHPALAEVSLDHDCTNDYEKVFKSLNMFPGR